MSLADAISLHGGNARDPSLTVIAWTEERLRKLKDLRKDGRSASEIAALLGGVSRNAVLGKLHRLGLGGGSRVPGRAKQQRRLKAEKAEPVNRAALLAQARRAKHQARIDRVLGKAPEVVPEIRCGDYSLQHADQPPSLELTLFQLKDATDASEGTCKWPYGDHDYRFCGQPTKRGSWCDYHRQRVSAA